jgi:hypothetical protein
MKLQSLAFDNTSVKTAGIAIASMAIALTVTAPAHAVSVFFGSTASGATQFDNTVTNAGGTVTVDPWTNISSGASLDRGAYTVTKINGSSLSTRSYGTLNGEVVNINPSSTDVQASRLGSGIRFSFNNAVNALGFEVGDWGTCCQPSSLYMSFDNGAPIKVGTSLSNGDVRFNGVYEAFVGAIDDTNTFSSVEFWGDGLGELLLAGGRIRYANVAIGSVSSVPEPFTIVGTLIGGTAALRMRKKLKSNNKV